jgi:hypothetical protein
VTILREKSPIGRTLWLTAAIVAAAFVAKTIVIQKGGDIVRVYDLVSNSTYAEDGLGISRAVGAAIVLVALAISVTVGWVIAALVGSLAVLVRRRS